MRPPRTPCFPGGRPPARPGGTVVAQAMTDAPPEATMDSAQWTTEELADLEETITAAKDAGNQELADYWTGIRDGSIHTTNWEDLRVKLYAKHGIDVSSPAA